MTVKSYLSEDPNVRSGLVLLLTVVVTGLAAWWGNFEHLEATVSAGVGLFLLADIWMWTRALEDSLLMKSGLPLAIKSKPEFFHKMVRMCDYYLTASSRFDNATFLSHLDLDVDGFLEAMKRYSEGHIDKPHKVTRPPYFFSNANEANFETSFMATSFVEGSDYWQHGEGLALLKKQGELVAKHPSEPPEDVTMRIFIRSRDGVSGLESAVKEHHKHHVPVKIVLKEDIQQRGEPLLKDFMLVDGEVLVRQEEDQGVLYTRVWIKGGDNNPQIAEATRQFTRLKGMGQSFDELPSQLKGGPAI